MNKDSILFEKAFYNSIAELPKENQVEVYNSIFEYSFNGTELKLDGLSNAIFQLIKTKLNSTNKEVKSIPNNKFNFKKMLLDYGANESLTIDWLTVRKNKKMSNTEHAFKLFINKVETTNLNINEILSICIDKSWGGFDPKWLDNINKNNSNKSDVILKYVP